MGKISSSFTLEYYWMENAFLHKNENLSLFDIVAKIQYDKDYIFDFIKTEQGKKLIGSVKNRYKFNKDEAEDAAVFAITEYFLIKNIDLDNFDEGVFLNNLKDIIGKKTQKAIREGYSAKEIPSTGMYENIEDNSFEEIVENGIESKKILKKLSERDREILELYYTDGKNQREVADEYNISQQQMSRILSGLKENLIKLIDHE